jgi:hypothetical protein
MTWQPGLEDYLQVVATVLDLDVERARRIVDPALADGAASRSATRASRRRSPC